MWSPGRVLHWWLKKINRASAGQAPMPPLFVEKDQWSLCWPGTYAPSLCRRNRRKTSPCSPTPARTQIYLSVFSFITCLLSLVPLLIPQVLYLQRVGLPGWMSLSYLPIDSFSRMTMRRIKIQQAGDILHLMDTLKGKNDTIQCNSVSIIWLHQSMVIHWFKVHQLNILSSSESKNEGN